MLKWTGNSNKQEEVIVEIRTDEEGVKMGRFSISSKLPEIETCLLLLSAVADILLRLGMKEGKRDD